MPIATAQNQRAGNVTPSRELSQRRKTQRRFGSEADRMDSRIRRADSAYIRQTTRGSVWKLPGGSTRDPGEPSGYDHPPLSSRHALETPWLSDGWIGEVELPEWAPHPQTWPRRCSRVGSSVVRTLFSHLRGQAKRVRPTAYRSDPRYCGVQHPGTGSSTGGSACAARDSQASRCGVECSRMAVLSSERHDVVFRRSLASLSVQQGRPCRSRVRPGVSVRSARVARQASGSSRQMQLGFEIAVLT
jgi:hypothetical protein